MAKQPKQTKQRQGTESKENLDISAALAGWSFQPGQINVRLIRGRNRKSKIQVRLELGVLQMELSGRPDGRRPHNSRSELDYQFSRLNRHIKAHSSDQDFQLIARDCQALRQESALYYHRYLSMFILGRFDAVIRDTQHNLNVLDLCRKYAASERDRDQLEQYRPYILMMQGRARGMVALEAGYANTALAYLRGTLRKIIAAYGQPEARKSMEAQTILAMMRDIRRQLPPDPRVELHRQLQRAVSHERYEEAASLRDQLMALHAADAASSGEVHAGNSSIPQRRESRNRVRREPPGSSAGNQSDNHGAQDGSAA